MAQCASIDKIFTQSSLLGTGRQMIWLLTFREILLLDGGKYLHFLFFCFTLPISSKFCVLCGKMPLGYKSLKNPPIHNFTFIFRFGIEMQISLNLRLFPATAKKSMTEDRTKVLPNRFLLTLFYKSITQQNYTILYITVSWYFQN